MTDSVRGKRIFLSGVSRGVGFAAARLLLENGARVFGVARDAQRLKESSAKLEAIEGADFTSLALDLASKDAPQVLHDALKKELGALDICIHNAGVMLHHEGGLSGEPEGILEQSLEINVLSPFRLTRALIPLLEAGEKPKIVNVGSGAGTHHGLTEPGIASYRLSKWTVNGLTMLQAKEFEGVISVNAFDPGWVRTDLGGPDAPGTAEEAAEGLLKTLELPFSVSGKFFKDGKEIPW